MVEPLSCPGPDVLQRFLAGNCPEPEARWLQEHLADCSNCQATMRTIPVDDRLVEAARDDAGRAEVRGEAVVEPSLSHLYRLGPSGTPGGAAAEGDMLPHQRRGAETRTDEQTEAAHDFLAPPEGLGEIGRLAGYRVFKLLGAGSMGVVLEAEDPRLKRRVALKVMRLPLAASATARQRFLREARALAAIRHDHVVPIYEVGEDRGIPFLVMPLLQGESLEQRLQREGRLSTAEVLRIGREAAEGLAAAHARGLIHRDVKPANIWLDAREDGQMRVEDRAPGGSSSFPVQLLDFGLARAAEGKENLTAIGVLIGTPAYMAPEQCRGETAAGRSDLFSLGITLYRMATGKLPFKGWDPTPRPPTLAQEPPVSPREINPDVPPALADLILQLLSRDPAMRPASAAEVAERLEALERQPATPTAAEPAHAQVPMPALPGPGRSGAWAWRRGGLAAALGLTVLLSLVYFFGGVVVRFATNQGQVVIEVNDPDMEVTLKEGGAVIQDRKRQRQLTLAAGQHELEVTVQDPAGEVHFFTKTLLLKRGGKVILNVRQELAQAKPAAAKPSGPDGKLPEALVPRETAEAERQAALWVLSRGGKGIIRLGDGKKELASARDLAAGSFQVMDVNFEFGSKPSDSELDHLADLPNLRSLKLEGEWVSDASLAHLKALRNLRRLDLDSPKVSDAGLEHLHGLTNLECLILINAAVTNLTYLKALRNLRRLDLVSTKVSDAGLVHLQELTNLNHLILINAAVTDAGLVHLQALPNLHHLELDNTRVTEAGMVHLEAFPNLTGSLTLGDQGVTDAWLERLKKLTKLTGLGLDGNPVTDAGLVSLQALRNLQELNLSHTKVGDAGLAHLKALRNLRQLRLAGTGVSDAGLANLKGLNNLCYLDLCGTRVTDVGLMHLMTLIPVGEFDLFLQGTRVSARGFAELKAAFPKANIEWWEPNRRAAEAVLAVGGTIQIRCQNQSDDRLVQAAADLPQEYFRLVRASLSGVRKPLGDSLAKVAALTDPQFDALESLDLSGSAVTDADLACLGRLSGLRRLVLDAAGVSVPGLVRLKGLTNLKELSLGCPGITDLGAGVVAELKGLERLSLAGSGLTDRGLETLRELSALQELDLTRTRVTAGGVAALQKALPKCRILCEPMPGK